MAAVEHHSELSRCVSLSVSVCFVMASRSAVIG